MSKYCPQCHCSMVIKSGIQNGCQRYKCKECGKTWQNKRRPTSFYNKLWNEFALNDLTVPQLVNKYGLSDKTNPDTSKLEYSHQKTRAAVNSLKTNLWYLFNCEFYHEYNIPNTNNRLEGINRALKYKLRHHSGASKDLKTKIAISFLSERTEV